MLIAVAGRAVVAGCALAVIAASARAQEVVTLGGNQFVLDCKGAQAGVPVVMVPGGNGSIESWARVQQSVTAFARACSYEPAGSAQRGQPGERQTMDTMAADLDLVLTRITGSAGAPAVLVAQQAGGILARRFAARFPRRVAGIVLLDSSHEEQMWRLAAIAPSLMEFSFGPAWKDPAAVAALGLLSAGQRSTWHTDAPLIVIEHEMGEPPPAAAKITPAQQKRLEAEWHAMQTDLAARSPRGELRTAHESGSDIQRQRPDMVIEAIEDVWKTAR